MITFANGHELDFCCASGALAFDGNGWWFEQPPRWAGWIRPSEMTIITKTLTFNPREGEYKWWCPWRCVRLLSGGATVNAVRLTNMGFYSWVNDVWPGVRASGYKTIVSFSPEWEYEALEMISAFNDCALVGLELNLSCPNVGQKITFTKMCNMIHLCMKASKHPLIVKLGVTHPIVSLARACKPAAWDLINSVPWSMIFPRSKSPLARLGGGGVSGPPIRELARQAITQVREAGVTTPIISGGAIDSAEEVAARFLLGADAAAFGTIFIRRPWLPNQIIAQMRKPPDASYVPWT